MLLLFCKFHILVKQNVSHERFCQCFNKNKVLWISGNTHSIEQSLTSCSSTVSAICQLPNIFNYETMFCNPHSNKCNRVKHLCELQFSLFKKILIVHNERKNWSKNQYLLGYCLVQLLALLTWASPYLFEIKKAVYPAHIYKKKLCIISNGNVVS